MSALLYLVVLALGIGVVVWTACRAGVPEPPPVPPRPPEDDQ